MSSGLIGALMSAILGALIASYSWRVAILVSGIAVVVMTVPMQWLFLSMDPREKGCSPLGGFRAEEQIPVSERKRVAIDLRLMAIVMLPVCVSFITLFNNHLPVFGQVRGITLVAPAMLLSLNMFGNMTFKLGFGSLNDYIGPKRTMVISFLLLILALLVFIFGNDLMVCIAAFVFGLNPMLTTTLCPLLAKDVWRRDEYPVILQTIQISSKLSYALFAVVEGALFDLWGRYNPLIVIQIIVCMMGLAFMLPLFIGKSSRCSRDSL